MEKKCVKELNTASGKSDNGYKFILHVFYGVAAGS